jgi:hypothetical protein
MIHPSRKCSFWPSFTSHSSTLNTGRDANYSDQSQACVPNLGPSTAFTPRGQALRQTQFTPNESPALRNQDLAMGVDNLPLSRISFGTSLYVCHSFLGYMQIGSKLLPICPKVPWQSQANLQWLCHTHPIRHHLLAPLRHSWRHAPRPVKIAQPTRFEHRQSAPKDGRDPICRRDSNALTTQQVPP